nr:unnamed protein product [Callosobruchus analis]
MTKSGLMKHMKYECGKDKHFQCIYCDHSTKQRYNLVVHVKHKHKDHLREFMQWYYERRLHQWNVNIPNDLFLAVSKVTMISGYTCPRCFKVFKNKQTLRCHINTDCGRPKKFKCQLCSYSSNRSYNLKEHSDRRHRGEPTFLLEEDNLSKAYKCDKCSKVYWHQASYYNHKKYTCGKSPAIFCPECKFSTKYFQNMQTHLRNIHSRTRDKTYEYRPLTTKSSGNIIKWEQFDSNILVPMVQMNSKNNNDFKAPYAMGSGFVCGDCGRTYKLKSSLRNHRKWECGKEPQFSCSHCSYRAKQKMHMLRHMERMHKDIEVPKYADEAKIPDVLVKELNSRGITYTTTKVDSYL